MNDREEIIRDDVWLTASSLKARIISTNMPDEHFPVLAWVTGPLLSYRLVHARLDGTVNSRPGVAHPDDLVERLS
jgi:hypothetical protein